MRAARLAVWSGSTAQLIACSAEQLFHRVGTYVSFWYIIQGRNCIHGVLQSTAENQFQSVKLGALELIKASLESHYSIAEVARSALAALETICKDGYSLIWQAIWFSKADCPINLLLCDGLDVI